jgi:hypothetical protein
MIVRLNASMIVLRRWRSSGPPSPRLKKQRSSSRFAMNREQVAVLDEPRVRSMSGEVRWHPAFG